MRSALVQFAQFRTRFALADNLHCPCAFMTRRLFAWGAAGILIPGGSARSAGETIYSFATGEHDIRMNVEFYDRYASHGFWFQERFTNREYCLSAEAEENRDCLAGFDGSLAVARYKVQPKDVHGQIPQLREHVRTIDEDAHLQPRPPFYRAIHLQHGVGSDIQAFGYEASAPQPKTKHESYGPWRLLRQDLYLEDKTEPFLVIHWKHSLNAIRILDMVPGEGTSVAKK